MRQERNTPRSEQQDIISYLTGKVLVGAQISPGSFRPGLVFGWDSPTGL